LLQSAQRRFNGTLGEKNKMNISLFCSRWFRLTFLTTALFISTAHAQSTPHLDGRIETDPAVGLLHGSFCLSEFPKQQTISFLLNRGFEVAASIAPA
jgi:hypothetical protein